MASDLRVIMYVQQSFYYKKKHDLKNDYCSVAVSHTKYNLIKSHQTE